MDLFRSEAVRHESNRLAGHVVLPAPLSMKLVSVFALLIVGSGGCLLATRSYNQRVTAQGVLAPEAGLMRVSSRQAGIVESLATSEGARVAAGAPIAVLRISQTVAEGDVSIMLRSGLDAEQRALEQGHEGNRQKLTDKIRDLKAEISHLHEGKQDAEQRLQLSKQALELAEIKLGRYSNLSQQGYMSSAGLDAIKSEIIVLRQNVLSSKGQISDIEKSIRGVEADIREATLDVNIAGATARREDAEQEQRRASLDSHGSVYLRSPVAGQVVAIPAKPGQMVREASTAAIVAPDGSPLIAEIYVPVKSSGFIAKGQRVNLMYSAFPFQSFGVGRGQILSVASTPLAPEEIDTIGVDLKEPFLIAKVAIERPFVLAYGKRVPLRPGMTLTANVVVGRQSLIAWIFDPLFAARGRS